MGLFSTPLGSGLITLGTAGIIAIVATLIKLSGRMSRVEGILELLVEKVTAIHDDQPPSTRRPKRRYPRKGAKRDE